MGLMPPQDAMFILGEDREQPMHVGSLQVFDLPEDAGDDFVARLYEQAIDVQDVAPLFRKRPRRSVTTGGQWSWVEDDDLDLEHHVRHSALPRPGRVRELLALASRLHGTLLDRKRPLWEAHLIEGLEGNRFAVYTKLHHSLMDGVSGLRLMQRSMSTDPSDHVDMPYANRPRPKRETEDDGGLLGLPGAALHTAIDAAGTLPMLLKLAQKALVEQTATLPMTAPRSMFNVSITGSRRFAADSWSLERIRAVAKAADATVNDVVLAMCSGALREYMLELDALPGSPLVAMTPVSLRSGDDDDEPSNAVGTILCSLGTHLADPELRLQAVRQSMLAGKEVMRGRSQLQVTALSAAVMTPLAVGTLLPLHRVASPPYNLVISNVPGPTETLYFNGARLEGLYPLSIPTQGQALNITVTSYDGHLQFGLTGCRRSVPRLQRLLGHLEDALTGLEKAYR
ncbi:MAG TPA: wax ester/triacylglycerol synthase family O-acyltransferase [Mycobacteriales bacterium]|nr:wax ester/triacylglycerol synthase family O-acyltransferase [Mycobacteriales bacterium]